MAASQQQQPEGNIRWRNGARLCRALLRPIRPGPAFQPFLPGAVLVLQLLANLASVAVGSPGAGAWSRGSPSARVCAAARESGWTVQASLLCDRQGIEWGSIRLRGGSSKRSSLSLPTHAGVQAEQEFGKEDQEKLNKYAGLNFRKKELLELLKEKEEEAEGLRGAADEILIAGLDGPESFQQQRSLPMGIDFRWGETFSEWSKERAEEELEHRVEMNQISQDNINEDLVEIEAEMEAMKQDLKGRFGDQVVLDDEDDETSEAETDDDLSESD